MIKKKKHMEGQRIRKLPFPSLRIDCYGKSTYVYLDGREITPGILSVNFRAKGGGKAPVLDLKMEPHAVSLEKVKKERVDTTIETDRHALLKQKKIK